MGGGWVDKRMEAIKQIRLILTQEETSGNAELSSANTEPSARLPPLLSCLMLPLCLEIFAHMHIKAAYEYAPLHAFVDLFVSCVGVC